MEGVIVLICLIACALLLAYKLFKNPLVLPREAMAREKFMIEFRETQELFKAFKQIRA